MSKRASPQQPWAQPINLDLGVNTVYDEVGAALSQGGLHLIFASHRRGGLGDFDLWQVDRTLSTANFGEPRNLGPTINTSHNDTVPKLSADDSVLLYAASRIGSQGGYDVWASTHDSRWESWSEPANLGGAIFTFPGGCSGNPMHRNWTFARASRRPPNSSKRCLPASIRPGARRCCADRSQIDAAW